MGEKLVTQTEPGSVATGYVDIYSDSNDSRRPKMKDEKGIVSDLSNTDRTDLIRNSGFWFAQRQVPGTLTTLVSSASGRNPSADGWGVTVGAADIQYQRVDTSAAPETGLQNKYYGTYKKTTTSGKMFISQVIEGTECQTYRGKAVRFQCWLKASSSKTLKMAVVQNDSASTENVLAPSWITAVGADTVDPTLGTNLAFIAPASDKLDNVTVGANAASCAVTTAWQRFSFVVTLPSDFKNIVVVIWTDSAFATNDTFSIAQVSLTTGHEIQDWNPLPYIQELHRVQRHYCKSFNIDQNPTTNVGVNTGEFKFMCVVGAATAFAGVGFRFPVKMRAAPGTLTLYNPSAANAQVRNITDAADCSSSAVTADGEDGAWINATSSAAAAAGEHFAVHWSADAKGTNNEFC